MEEGGWGNGVASKVPGMLVRANNSATLQTITLADNDDMAILVKPNISQFLKFRATTFGARASCQAVNPLCDKTGGLVNCTGFPVTFPPASGSVPIPAISPRATLETWGRRLRVENKDSAVP